MRVPMLSHNIVMSIKYLYEPSQLILQEYAIQNESTDYSAATFLLAHHRILYRDAKITPTKAGLFVTIWKRNGTGPIIPFDMNDPIDFFIIGINENNRMGQFIFPKSVLVHHDYVSKYQNGGKRAMRVYPPWTDNLNAQARKTHAWQALYFFEISNQNTDAIKRLALLLGI